MKFEQTATIPASRARVWAFLMDVPRVARCVPGVENVEPVDENGTHYRGTLKVRVGPIGLSLQGDVSITERDEATGVALMAADAADKRIGGAVKSAMKMMLTETSGGESPSTELRIETDAQVMGRIGEFGQPVIRKKADQIMTEFANNVRKAVTEDQRLGS